MITRWNPNAVYGPLRRANTIAIRETQALATSLARSRAHIDPHIHVTQVGDKATLHATNPVAHFFEGGVKPHVISQRGKVLYLKELNRFVSGEVHHPGMGAAPFMHPAAAAYPGIFARVGKTQFRI